MSRVGIPRQAPIVSFRATATAGTNTTAPVLWGTEVYDFGGNFAANTFTAPVRGIYHFECQLQMSAITAVVTTWVLDIVADGTTYSVNQIDTGIATDVHTVTNSVDCIMDAATTAVVNITTDIAANAHDAASTFSGRLVAAL